MPSTTPNYSLPYPISGDDLNAGATQIGNLANAVDYQLLSANQTRQGADVALQNNIDALAATRSASKDSLGIVIPNVYFADWTVTTNGSGILSNGSTFDTSRAVVTAGTALGFIYVILVPASATTYFASGQGLIGGWGVVTNTAVNFRVVYW